MGIAVDMANMDLNVNSIKIGATVPGGAGGTDITSTITETTVNVGASGTAGTLKVFPSTASKGDLKITATNNTGNTETSITNAAYGQATTLTIPDPGAATAKFVLDTAAVSTTFAAGTTSVAPINLTSGTNLTSVTAGAIEFDGNAFYATPIAGSRSVVDTEQYIIQATEPTADNAAGLDSNALAAVFTAGTGAITLTAGKTYMFEGVYMITNTGTTSHTWGCGFGGTATFTATGTGYQAWGITNTGNGTGTASAGGGGMRTGFTATGATTTIAPLTSASTSATENVTIQVCGTLVVNAGGTLIPQMQASARPGASGTPGVLHKAGSFFRIWQAPTLGTVGNWS